MHTPTNCTTSASDTWKSSIKYPNIGATAKGPNPIENVDINVLMIAKDFHSGDQFYSELHGQQGKSFQNLCRTIPKGHLDHPMVVVQALDEKKL